MDDWCCSGYRKANLGASCIKCRNLCLEHAPFPEQCCLRAMLLYKRLFLLATRSEVGCDLRQLARCPEKYPSYQELPQLIASRGAWTLCTYGMTVLVMLKTCPSDWVKRRWGLIAASINVVDQILPSSGMWACFQAWCSRAFWSYSAEFGWSVVTDLQPHEVELNNSTVVNCTLE